MVAPPRTPATPAPFIESIASFEAWMAEQLGCLLVTGDLRHKHKRMRRDPFLFLRGTCWRWAEIAGVEAPELMEGPAVGSVGDAHVGNFGLWRDAEGRLVWGVNDFDEAATIPYRMDLARLVTSARLARRKGDTDGADSTDDRDLAEAALDGYAAGIADPRPWVLEQDHVWLRDLFAATDHERVRFWAKLRDAKPAGPVATPYRAALERAVESAAAGATGPIAFSRRRAGVGSLGRPRLVALADDAGGPIAREAKALLPSCWDRDAPAGQHYALARGRYRSPDPFLRAEGGIVSRRLAPNSRKIDIGAHKRRVRRRLIGAMARDIGAIHAADARARAAIVEHLAREGHAWLDRAADAMVEATRRDWHAFRAATDHHGTR